ncbi:hypothetical protein [Tissierella sp.]|uniref:hypothetical protein n=1 Tax=Tissierella sp. TaxID=41274 RepID=UPI0028B1FFEC|nr:hypothetical protein [Tissierella sp.]
MGDRYYKKYIEKLIDSNPIEIKYKRREKIDDGFGGEITKDVDKKEVVTFYDRKARREVVTDYGTTYIGVTVTKILAKGNADIVKGDKFTANGVEYRVVFVEPFMDICKQIEVEVIK